MQGFSQSDDPLLPEHPQRAIPATGSPASGVTGNPRKRSALEEPELDAALQLLVERAQYITGATGTALALPQGEEMVCRASAGSCAPAVGARLQVRSGLTGESITRRQLLRCDNAEADPRVNLEACRALGIASIVVLPLLRRNGEVRGLFELFSDHPYAFEERDLSALERMADLTLIALDLAEQRHGTVAPSSFAKQTEKPAGPASGNVNKAHPAATGFASAGLTSAGFAPAISAPSEPAPPQSANVEPAVISVAPLPSASPELSSPGPVPILESALDQGAPLSETILHVQKCAACGFPVSEGRTLCLDCDKLAREKFERGKKESAKKHNEEHQAATSQLEIAPQETETDSPTEPSAVLAPDEIPPFLANASVVKESWLANHVNLLAILVLVLGILVVIVVFR
jgi:putative methionine-R-sulfoxide reductase with GAF domain